MSLIRLTRRRRQAAIVLLAHVVVLAYVFQMFAFDHWGPVSQAGSDGHAAHCHGDAPGCAGIADAGSSLHVRLAPPIPPESHRGYLDVAMVTPENVVVTVAVPPPQA